MTRSSLGLLSIVAGLGLAACSGTPKLPTGPSPEYEDPPAPSWLKDGGAAVAPAPAPPSILDAPPPPAAADAGGVPPS
jgi:hypothetical protein